MKTTLELPDDLVREIKRRAVQKGCELQEEVHEILLKGMNPTAVSGEGKLVAKSLPLIKVRPAPPSNLASMSSQELCEWMKDIDLQGEVERYEAAFGHQHLDRVNAGDPPAS